MSVYKGVERGGSPTKSEEYVRTGNFLLLMGLKVAQLVELGPNGRIMVRLCDSASLT